MSLTADETALQGAVVVVIEDDAMQLLAMQMLLQSWGCTVIPATTAAEAEQALSASRESPQVIISDFRLPEGASGLQAVEQLRAAAGTPLPAILQTGDTDPAVVHDADRHGFLVLHKPYDPNCLRRLVADLLAQH